MVTKAKKKIKILVCDPLDQVGIDIFNQARIFNVESAIKVSNADLKKAIKDASGVVVRSGTRLTSDIINAGSKLQIIGRAGVGIDNVDVDAASRKGVVVANTPGGNTISAAEHTVSLMLCLVRNVAKADASMKKGLWDRKKFTGVELFQKTLGLIGLGRIGTEVAKRASSFGMRILAYDPFLRADKARALGVEQVSLEEIYKQSDLISLHVPLTAETKNIVDAQSIRKMKNGIRIINCARGGLINEKDALEALNKGKIAGIALDVYEKEPPEPSKFLQHPNVLQTPHLGASTEEAQIKVSKDIAQTMADYLAGKGIRNALNLPSVASETLKEMEPFCNLTDKMGSFLAQLAEGKLLKVDIKYLGKKLSEYPATPMTTALLRGLLSHFLAQDVNSINAAYLAKERGIKVSVTKSSDVSQFANLIHVTLKTDKHKLTIGGTIYGTTDARIVMLDDFRLESIAKGYLLVIENKDVPGTVGKIGTLLGKNKINIADMSVGRSKANKCARIVINIDAPISDALLKKLRSDRYILNAKFIQL